MSHSDPSFCFDIAPVELRIARDPASPGRVEKFTHSAHLMRRLDAIGRRQLLILALTEGGQELPAQHLEALNLYLRSLRGLRSFKRVSTTLWTTKYAWSQLRESLDIPTLAILVAV